MMNGSSVPYSHELNYAFRGIQTPYPKVINTNHSATRILFGILKKLKFVCLCWGFTAQSTQWGHVERGQFT